MESGDDGRNENAAVASAVLSERQRLLNFIRKRVRTEEDAEDILQDVFFQLTENYDIAEPIEEPVAWQGPIVMNTREELRKAYLELESGTFIK